MNRNIFKIVFLLLGLFVSFSLTSCSEDDEPEKIVNPGEQGGGESNPGGDDQPGQNDNVIQKTVTLSRKTNYGNDWIYFSLSEGKELEGINEDNRAENKSWDLAFNRYNIRTNSGLSGKGQGGALDTGLKDLNLIASVPEGEFVVDSMGIITAGMTGFPPPTMESPLNGVLADAIHFQGPPPTYTPNEHVYIVKTADGKYAKIQIQGFYNDEGQSGYVTFTYVYQPNGSKNF